VIITFSYTTDGDHAVAVWGVCVKDTLAIDGLGLPGHHGCGDNSVPYPSSYVG